MVSFSISVSYCTIKKEPWLRGGTGKGLEEPRGLVDPRFR